MRGGGVRKGHMKRKKNGAVAEGRSSLKRYDAPENSGLNTIVRRKRKK